MRVQFRVTQFTRSLMTTVPLDEDAKARVGSVPADLSGNFDSILDIFRTVPRLVITGPAGSGKSVLCLKLAGDLLSRPAESGDRLPVILLASAWKPGESLDQWVARELTGTDQELSLRPRGSASKKTTLAQALAASRVIPIIDGLDELPAALRGEAIKRINEAGSDRPLVVTSRPAEYTGALAAAGREVARAAVVGMQPLTLPIVQGYLREAATPRSLSRWQLMFDQLDRAPDGPLAAALTNPLLLWLCRRIYSQDDRDAAELAERPDLGSRRAIENHLLDAFLPAIYRDSGESSLPWTAAQARQYLGFLASYLEETRSPDLPWWRLQQTVAGWRIFGFIVRGASLSALACWLAVWVLRRAGDWQDGSYTGRVGLEKLLLGGPAAPLIRAAADRIDAILEAILHSPAQQPPARTPRFPGGWLLHDVAAGLDTVPWPLYVVVIGTAVFAGYMLEASSTRSPALIASIRLRYSVIRAVGALVGECLLAAGVVEVLLKLPHRSAAHAGSAAGGLFIVAAIAVACLASDGFRAVPADLFSTKNPVMVLRGDRRVHMCAFSLLLILVAVVWCCCGPAMAAAVGVLGGAYVLSELVLGPTGSGAFVATRAWLALTHRMPLRTLTFLEDAHERGALSRTGSVYQFRHLQLQRHLARERVRLPGPARTRLVSLIADNYLGLPTSTGALKRWALWFKEQADALTEAVGPAEAAGPVYQEPPGVAQRFGTADGRDWVMCALPDRYPVLASAIQR